MTPTPTTTTTPAPGIIVRFDTPTGRTVYGTVLDITTGGSIRVIDTARTHDTETLDADHSRPVRLYVVDPADATVIGGPIR